MSVSNIINIRLKIVSIGGKSPRFCRFSLFLCLVKIAFKRLKPDSTMQEVGNASKKYSAAALRLGFSVAALILLQYSLRFLLLNSALLSRSTCISIS